MPRNSTYAKAINEALAIALESDPNVICYGLGVDDPKGVFGTTLGLKERFGGERVFDMPTSENAMTGIAIGAALNGIRPVMTHQRLDFFLLAMDQLVNNAAKWHFMFGGKMSVPITIRLILGRGWGQGPTHSQSLHSWFAHVPGLKVVMPTTAHDAKGMLLSSIFDNNPVLFLEHRWLHNIEGDVPEDDYRIPIGKAALMKKGKDLTIISISYMTIEALHVTDLLEKNGINCELIDLRSVSPLDWEAVYCSVKKTGRLIVLDISSAMVSVAGEIVARVSMDLFEYLKCAPARLALPDYPSPTSYGLSKTYYKRAEDIVSEIGKMMGKDLSKLEEEIVNSRKTPHDSPGDWFKGPF
ncbi:MAG: alpha-ketoacid dehydrogenase subunit beta [Spirochaetae bacterium HGW-Spirochaetae-1]|jgi:pyruvate dehydrogenase E1 component beta subunit|nr:MAG: alpha-ketoacid dehydrogenase subunit beta [Spirochaetae bacterium HGW-Spirochaetae-1]